MLNKIQFPDPRDAEDDGLVAVGGELSEEFLLSAYSQGIFPWFNEGEPILWWSPNPRMILSPEKFKISRSLEQTIRSKKYHLKIDTCFKDVITNCSKVSRKNQSGTWITTDMIAAYTNLHEKGYAHSIETFYNNELVGGLYGISLGKAFFGESMFYTMSDASKIALHLLCRVIIDWDYDFIDVQQSTDHLRSLGAEDINRDEFLKKLEETLKKPTKIGKW
jgi:leucyl/phenylalanyl-tRNA--protein transferase